ncbi:hypothetical protein [Asticcacaulis sp. W401b]|uniref:hypothetical protein n=1 Tax=Asticcacaulis sp. W401b TaxID=3388666 RepID=UPI0039705F32
MDGKANTGGEWLERYWVWLAAGTVTLAWILNLGIGWWQLWSALRVSSETYINAGVFGDMFGAVNALFSGLSIIGIVYAIRQQDQQLKLARAEVKTAQDTLRIAIEDADKTKSILEEQQAQSRAQNEALRTQAYENTLFNVIQNLLSAENGITVRSTRTSNGEKEVTIYRGKDAFYNFAVGDAQKIYSGESRGNDTAHLTQIADRYYSFFVRNSGNYFRILENAFSMTAASPNRHFYSNIVKSNLTSTQVLTAALIGISEKAKTLKAAIEENALLDIFADEPEVFAFFRHTYSAAAFGLTEED